MGGWIVAIILVSAITIAIIKGMREKFRKEKILEKENKLISIGFQIDQSVTDINNRYSMFVDDLKEQWAVYDYNDDICNIYKYEDLVAFEIKEDNQSLISGRAGSAVVGGLLFGGIGALAGSSMSRKVQDSICESFELLLTINNMKSPNFKIEFIDKEIRRDSREYEEIMGKAEKVVSIIKLILEKNKKNIKVKSEDVNIAEELREFKKLLDEGIITEEEFNQRKKEMLKKK